MYRRFVIFTCTFLICFIGCKKDDSTFSANTLIKIVTGFECRSETGDTYAIIGKPDIKTSDVDKANYSNVKYFFVSAPNPNYSYGYYHEGIYFYASSRVPVNYSKFWIEKVYYNEVPDQSKNTLGANTFVANPIINELDSLNFDAGYCRFGANASQLEPGYYRAYMQINDVLLWDNLIINLYPF